MTLSWLRQLSPGRFSSLFKQAQAMALSHGVMSLKTPQGRDWLDAAVDLDLPVILNQASAASLFRDRRPAPQSTPRVDPRSSGWSLLHEAAYRGHWRCVQAILKKRSNPQPRDANGVSPLRALFLLDPQHDFTRHDGGCPSPHGPRVTEDQALSTLGVLLEAGARPAGGELSQAARLGWGRVCERLISAGSSPKEMPDAVSQSYLIEACLSCFWEGSRSPKTLARLSAQTPLPLLLAILSESALTVSALAPAFSDPEIEQAAALAAGVNQLGIALSLLAERPNARTQPALCALARRPKVEDSPQAAHFALWLVSRGADPRLPDASAPSPYSALQEAARAHKPLLVQALIEAPSSAALKEEELLFLNRLLDHHAYHRPKQNAALDHRQEMASRSIMEGFGLHLALDSISVDQAAPRAKPASSRRL